MKLNIFSIPKDQISELRKKFDAAKMSEIKSETIENWSTSFYFSDSPEPVSIPWIKTFSNIFSDRENPKNQIYYGAYVWEKGDSCFVLSFGKSHFYLRAVCDPNFGLEIAKRIANENDVRQKAAKRFAGKKRKEIRSYDKNTSLDVESGESIDYIQASIVDHGKWGKTGKFGTSVLLCPEIKLEDLAKFMDNFLFVYQSPQLFDLPKTEVVTNKDNIQRYDAELIESIKKSGQCSDFSDNNQDLVGVDFIFPTDQTYQFYIYGNHSEELNYLDMDALRNFINENNIQGEDIFNIKIKIKKEDTKPYSVKLKQSIEYKVDGENVVLSRGKWMKFNEDYMNQLHTYIDSKIELNLDLDQSLSLIRVEKGKGEPQFNELMSKNGFENGDKDFSNIDIKNHKIEAWDLRKGKTVYAVKFGNAKKVGYVCEQATNMLEIMRNNPKYIKKLNFDNYCLWIGFENKKLPTKLSEINSIIFKQNLDFWARKCHELGIKPCVWLSKLERI